MSAAPDAMLFALGVLATWRLAHLVVAEDGPWEAVARLRRLAGDGAFGRSLDCFYCMSLWVALPVAWMVVDDAISALLAWPALSGGAILVQRGGGFES